MMRPIMTKSTSPLQERVVALNGVVGVDISIGNETIKAL
jgi:hypothetical protein